MSYRLTTVTLESQGDMVSTQTHMYTHTESSSSNAKQCLCADTIHLTLSAETHKHTQLIHCDCRNNINLIEAIIPLVQYSCA